MNKMTQQLLDEDDDVECDDDFVLEDVGENPLPGDGGDGELWQTSAGT